MYNLLIADDEPKSRTLLSTLNWESLGIHVSKAVNNGLEALDYIQKNDIDIVLTDIKMPFMDGIELAEKLQSIKPEIIVVVLSGYDDYTFVRQCMKKSNVYDYLLKPIDPDEWITTFRNITKKLEGLEIQLDIIKSTDSKKHIIDSVINFVQNHYAEQITLSHVADYIHISHAYLSRVINEELGMGFSDLLNMIRIEYAKKLLKNPSYKINEIADMVGYSSPQYFTYSFKKQVGQSPWQYRSK